MTVTTARLGSCESSRLRVFVESLTVPEYGADRFIYHTPDNDYVRHGDPAV